LTAKRRYRDLDAELKRLEEIEPAVNAAADRFREYRSALITAAVTGQLDIREPEKKMGALV
jgi:hypothetical protein